MKPLIWITALAGLVLVHADGLSPDSKMDEEPHTYTVSFFQFDPKDLLGTDKTKTVSKKDIKKSDSNKANHHGQVKGQTRGMKSPLNPNPQPSDAEAALSLPHPLTPDGQSEKSGDEVGELSRKNETEVPLAAVNQTVANQTDSAELVSVNSTTNSTSSDVSGMDNSTSTVDNAESGATNASQTPPIGASSPVRNITTTNATAIQKPTDIKPVQNTVDGPSATTNAGKKSASGEDESSTITQAVHETVENKTGLMSTLRMRADETKKASPSNSTKANSTSSLARSRIDNNPPHREKATLKKSKSDKEKQLHHRQMIAHFVPIYHVSAKDHGLSYQRGSIKHPSHSLYPQCHTCPANSSYAKCVKHATLKKCNKGLSNICYTKSKKRNGVITYQMGCANHAMCAGAKAFPCKDGSKSCFTCCQWDRCNSSPHHGNFELDELRLDELQPSSSIVHSTSGFIQFAVVGANLLVLWLLF